MPAHSSVPLDAIRQPALLYDASGHIVASNDRADALAGRPLAGLSIAEKQALLRLRNPGGEEYSPAELPVARALRGEEVVDVPLEVTAPNGRTVHVLATASPIRDGETVTGALVVWRDVTALVRAEAALCEGEARFRLALRNAPTALFYQDRDLRYTWVSNPHPVFAEAGLVGKTDADVMGADDAARITALKQRVLETGTAARAEVPVTVGDATGCYDLSVEPLLDPAGATVGVMGVSHEVTEQRRAEAALAESEARARVADAIAAERGRLLDILESLPAIISLLSPDHRVVFANRRHRELFGESRGRTCHETCFGSPEPCAFCEAFVPLETGRPHRWECTTPAGRIIEVCNVPFTDTDGTPMILEMDLDVTEQRVAVAALGEANAALDERVRERTLDLEEANARLRDEVAERKLAEAALARERERLQTIIDDMIDGYYVYDREWRFVEINQRAAEYFGLPREELVGRNVWELFPHTVGGYTWTRFHQAVAEGVPVRFETQSGVNEESFEVYVYPRPEGLAVYLREITDLKRAEARQAFLLQLADAIRPLADPVAVQGEATRLLGGHLAVARVAYGEVTDDAFIVFEHNYVAPGAPLVTGRYRMAEFGPALVAALKEKRTIVVPEVACAAELSEAERAAYAALGIASLVGVPLVKAGRLAAELVVHHTRPRDWSRDEIALIEETAERTWAAVERARAEASLREYAENLRRSNEDLERFAYVSSHDLQEPLRSIVSFSQLLERRYRGELDPEADEYIEFIVEGGNRMQTLIQDLLAYSRVNTTKQAMARTDVAEVLAGVERSLALQLRETGIVISHDPLPVVTADPLQLEQVFMNLVSNAVKFRRPDVPLRVHVGARRLDGFWEFSVADNGIGIEPEYFEKIFVIFQRLHTHDAYPGTGIGLAIVKRIIDRHGGTVRVESRPGEGSTFRFTLPAA